MTSETFGNYTWTPTKTAAEGGSWPPTPPNDGQDTTFSTSNVANVTKLIIDRIIFKPAFDASKVAVLVVYKDDDVTQEELITFKSLYTESGPRSIEYGLEVDGPISATATFFTDSTITIQYRVLSRS